MSDLFRRQAAEHQQQRLYGEILLARPLSFTYLVGFFALVVAGLVAFLILGSYTRKETVPGVLVPDQGVATLTATQGGQVGKRLVQNGQVVQKGQALYEIILSPDTLPQGGSAQDIIERTIENREQSLRQELGEQRRQAAQNTQGLRDRAQLLARQVGQLDGEIALAQKQVGLAQDTATRYETLSSNQYVSATEVQQKQAAVVSARAQVEALRRQQLLVRQELSAVSNEIRANSLAAARESTTLLRQVDQLSQDRVVNDAQKALVIRAPLAGTVSALSVQPGQTLTPGQALGTIVPEGSILEAEVYAPSSAMGFVKVGTPVLLRYPAFPYQKFGQYPGVVKEISATPFTPSQLPSALGINPNGQPLYRLRVKLDRQSIPALGEPQPLRAGMQLEAGLVLERRRLYEWIFEPLYSVSGDVK